MRGRGCAASPRPEGASGPQRPEGAGPTLVVGPEGLEFISALIESMIAEMNSDVNAGDVAVLS